MGSLRITSPGCRLRVSHGVIHQTVDTGFSLQILVLLRTKQNVSLLYTWTCTGTHKALQATLQRCILQYCYCYYHRRSTTVYRTSVPLISRIVIILQFRYAARRGNHRSFDNILASVHPRQKLPSTLFPVTAVVVSTYRHFEVSSTGSPHDHTVL